MILYKYRSNNPFEYVKEIVGDGLFYFADWQQLNDPMEGYFSYSKSEMDAPSIESIVSGKHGVRICSLSKRYNDPRMWTYYANGHRGICIGVRINNDIDLSKVSYQRNIPRLQRQGGALSHSAKSILSAKVSLWKHEQEYRAFINANAGEERASLGQICCVIFGLRSTAGFKNKVKNLISDKFLIYEAFLDFNNNLVHRRKIDGG